MKKRTIFEILAAFSLMLTMALPFSILFAIRAFQCVEPSQENVNIIVSNISTQSIAMLISVIASYLLVGKLKTMDEQQALTGTELTVNLDKVKV